MKHVGELDDFVDDIRNDETLSDIRDDLMVLDQSVQTQLSLQEVIPNTSDIAVEQIYDEFTKKFGIQIGYTKFKDFIQHIGEQSKFQKEVLEAVNAKVATQIAQLAGLKLMITINTLIERSSTAILKVSEGLLAPDPVVIGMIDKMIQWQQQLKQMQDDYTSLVSDPDSALQRLKDSMDNKNVEISDEEKAEQTKLVADILNNLKSL